VKQPPSELRRGLEHMLAVVEQQDGAARAQPFGQLLGGEPGRAHGFGHHGSDRGPFAGRGEITEDWITALAFHGCPQLDGEPGLATAARACQRQQPAAGGHPPTPRELFRPAHEAGQLSRKAAHRRQPVVSTGTALDLDTSQVQ
jgi:hypothetical protein